MREDAVVGVTSNPTIFQKALAEGDCYDEQLARGARRRGRPEGDLPPARGEGHPATPATCCGRSGTTATGKDGYVSIEVDPTLAYEREETFEEAIRLHEGVDRPNVFVKIPATEPGLAAIEDAIAKGRSINVTLIFSLERYAAVAEAYIRGLERLVAAGGDPSKRRVGRELLRLARRHGGGQAARRDRRPGDARCRASSRSRTRSSRTSTGRSVLRRALGVPRRQGRDDAALPVGVDLDEEPRVPRRDVRRGADRPGDRQHDAARDVGAFQDHGEVAPTRSRGLDEARSCSSELAGSASTTTTSSRRSRRRACRSSPTRSSELLDGIRAKRRRAGRRRDARASSSGSGRYDASLWTDSDEDRWLGWLDVVPRVRAHVDELNAFAEAATEQFDDCVLLGHGRLVARAGGAAADVRGRVVPRPRHDAPRGDPAARARASTSSGRSSSPPRSRARRSRRARTSSTSGSGPAAAARSSPRSPTPAPSSRSSRTSAGSGPSSPASRRSAAATRRSRCSGSCRRR